MLIACPSRARSYFVEPASLQPDGRRVHSRSVWRNEPSRVAELMAAAEGLAPDTLVPDALVAQWPPSSPAGPIQTPRAHAEVAVAGEPRLLIDVDAESSGVLVHFFNRRDPIAHPR
jgi:hypothetical protein